MSAFAKSFSDQLTKDLEWREAELALMRKELHLTQVGTLRETVLLRASAAMVYAHYEGFCKFGLEIYIDALEKLKLTPRQLSWPLASLSMGKLRSVLIAQPDSRQFFEKVFADFNPSLDDTAVYERPPQIANLWPDLLVSWLVKLGLGSKIVSDNHSLLESLVNRRNLIAHGRKLMIADRKELDRLSNAAILAMHEVAVEIVEALDAKAYLRVGTSSVTLQHAP